MTTEDIIDIADATTLAERAVVGECMTYPNVVRVVAGVIAPQDFRDTRLGQLYGLILGMVTAGGIESVTPVTVFQEVAARRAADADKDQQIERTWAHKRLNQIAWHTAGELAFLVTHGTQGLPEVNARVIRENAVLRSLALFGRRVVQQAEGGMDAATTSAAAFEDLKRIRDGSRRATLSARPLSEVLAEDDHYEWLIPGLLERSDRLIVTGAEGLGKSTFLRQIALCGAGGLHPFTAEEFPRLKVLVIDAENSERQWRRSSRSTAIAVKAASQVDAAELLNLACVGRMDITSAGDLGGIHSLLDEHEPDLVVIGPLYKLVPRAITTDDDAAPVLAALDSLRDRGVALMMEAHAGHALGKGGERDYRPRGSSALLGWPEFGFGLAPDPEDKGRVQVIRWRGDRDERAWPEAMRRGGELPWTNDRREPSKKEQAEALAQRDFGLRAVND